jgi:drug/metabolite transporter (DMT)-like permease
MWAADAPFRKPLLVGGLGVGFVSFLEHLFNSLAALPGLIKNFSAFKQLTFKHWLGFIYIGVGASALGAILYVRGAVMMDYNFTIAALLQKLQPLFAITLAAIFLKERLTSRFWLAAAPALFGAYLVTFGWVNPFNLWTRSSLSLLGPVFAIGAALLWAGGTVVGRALMMKTRLHLVNGMRFVFGCLFLGVYVAYFEKFQFSDMTALFWRNVVFIAMLTGFFALLLYYYGLKSTPASVATLMELGYPLALTIINWVFLGIHLSAAQIIGAVILLFAITWLSVVNI